MNYAIFENKGDLYSVNGLEVEEHIYLAMLDEYRSDGLIYKEEMVEPTEHKKEECNDELDYLSVLDSLHTNEEKIDYIESMLAESYNIGLVVGQQITFESLSKEMIRNADKCEKVIKQIEEKFR